MASSPNDFSWGCEFLDGESIVAKLQYDLRYKLDDGSALAISFLAQICHVMNSPSPPPSRMFLVFPRA